MRPIWPAWPPACGRAGRSSPAWGGGRRCGGRGGLSRAAMAREIFPVLEINAGRQVDVIVINGTQLKIKAEGGAVDTTPTQGAKK